MEMANYILSILKCNITYLWSWGAHNFKAIENGLAFSVQGFVFTGKVKVIYEEGSDTFKVILEKDGNVVREEGDVYLDCLSNVIDGMVEKDCSQEAYVEKVNSAYGWK